MKDAVANYLKATRSPFYSLFYVLPLALFYEILLFVINRSDVAGVRNSADILLKRFLGQIGFHGFEASVILFLLIFILLSLLNRKTLKKQAFHWAHYPLIILESAVYAALMIFLFAYILRSPVLLNGNFPDIRYIVYSVGAGVYEELLFRGLMLQGMIMLLYRIENLNRDLSLIFSVLVTSLIFVGIHYVGAFGDVFDITSFFIRFLASLILSIIYLQRGFALAAYSHTLYDIFVIII